MTSSKRKITTRRPISIYERNSGCNRPREFKKIVIGGPFEETEHIFVNPTTSITTPNTGQLVSLDEVHIELGIDDLYAMDSCVITNWTKSRIEFGSVLSVLRLQYKTDIVLRLIDFCMEHAVFRNRDEYLKYFDSKFVKENRSILIDLLSAACRLQIRSLLDVTSESVADMITGKTAEEILKMFNLKEDFTFKEMEVVLEYNTFCFKGLIELQLSLMDKAENSFNLKHVREKIAVDDKSKVFAAKYSSLTHKEKKTWVIAAVIIREKRRLREIAVKKRERSSKTSRQDAYLTEEEMRMMREDVDGQEVAPGCENEESETFELNDLFISD